jgi:hypothetical protein
MPTITAKLLLMDCFFAYYAKLAKQKHCTANLFNFTSHKKLYKKFAQSGI